MIFATSSKSDMSGTCGGIRMDGNNSNIFGQQMGKEQKETTGDNFEPGLKETSDHSRSLPLQLPPAVGWRKLIHITRFIVSFVSQVKGQLVP